MESVSWNEVPGYLQDGTFYEGLDQSDHAPFEVPHHCFKTDPGIECESDLVWVFHSVRFWATREVPIAAIQYMLEHCGVSDLEKLLEEFVEQQDFITNILKLKAASLSDGLVVAITAGLKLPVVRLLREKGYELNIDACEAAATVGNLDILMYLHEEGCPWDERTTTAAATGSHLTCLEYALDLNCPCDVELMNKMAQLGLSNVLKTLHDRGLNWDEKTALHAIRDNRVECLKFLHGAGCEITPVTLCGAAKYGSMECMEFLHAQGVDWHDLTCYYAARFGQLATLTYAHAHGAEWNELTSYAAASYGHLDCLIYLHKHDCMWNERALKGAIAGGYWPCARYCYDHNCPQRQTSLIIVSFTLTIIYAIKALFFPYSPPFHDVAMLAIFIRVPLWMFLVEYREPLQRDSKIMWFWRVLDPILVVFNFVLVYLMWLWYPLVLDFWVNYIFPLLGVSGP